MCVIVVRQSGQPVYVHVGDSNRTPCSVVDHVQIGQIIMHTQLRMHAANGFGPAYLGTEQTGRMPFALIPVLRARAKLRGSIYKTYLRSCGFLVFST